MPTKPTFRVTVLALAVSFSCNSVFAQSPTSCASIASRANSNGQANSCPNVNATPYASNFASTSYATVPASSKTGDLTLSYTGTISAPYAITRVWITSSGTSLTSISFGPASVPAVSGGNTQVTYCFYGMNMPTIGTVSFQMTDPQTGVAKSICSYDASCTSNCSLVANPAGLSLPVTFSSFTAAKADNNSVLLRWSTAMETNNKGFYIERQASPDNTYATIAFVPSSNLNGTASSQTVYSYSDQAPPAASTVKYRLRQEDLDGHQGYSSVQVVSTGTDDDKVRIFTAGSAINITIAAGGPYDITVYDPAGRALTHKHVQTAGTLNLPGLTRQSLYYVEVKGSRKTTKAIYLN